MREREREREREKETVREKERERERERDRDRWDPDPYRQHCNRRTGNPGLIFSRIIRKATDILTKSSAN